MGLSEREYYGEQRSYWPGGRSVVVNLILVNVAVWALDLISEGQLGTWLCLKPEVIQKPWLAWELLTYGFVHDTHTNAFAHIFWNMFGLWLFGADLEGIYGKAEFLRLYLTAIIFSGLIWIGIEAFQGTSVALVGASGGVMGLMMVFVLNFPRRIFYIWGILPVPAWGLGIAYVAFDIIGAAHNSDNVAHIAHLAGAGYGFLYFRTHWTLGSLIPHRLAMPRWRPKLKIHRPDTDARDLNEQVDEILAKISRTGEGSLTSKERDTLERASRRYQQRRQ